MAELEELQEDTAIEGPFFGKWFRVFSVKAAGCGLVSIIGEGLNTSITREERLPAVSHKH